MPEQEESCEDSIQWTIDPQNLTMEKLPFIMGAILIELQTIRKEQRNQRDTLKEHSDCLAPFRFSRCQILPWMERNKYALAVVAGTLTAWLSFVTFVTDWISRAVQGGFFPPKVGGP